MLCVTRGTKAGALLAAVFHVLCCLRVQHGWILPGKEAETRLQVRGVVLVLHREGWNSESCRKRKGSASRPKEVEPLQCEDVGDASLVPPAPQIQQLKSCSRRSLCLLSDTPILQQCDWFPIPQCQGLLCEFEIKMPCSFEVATGPKRTALPCGHAVTFSLLMCWPSGPWLRTNHRIPGGLGRFDCSLAASSASPSMSSFSGPQVAILLEPNNKMQLPRKARR